MHCEPTWHTAHILRVKVDTSVRFTLIKLLLRFNLQSPLYREINPSDQKAACRSVFLTIWHCILGTELTKTHSFRLSCITLPFRPGHAAINGQVFISKSSPTHVRPLPWGGGSVHARWRNCTFCPHVGRHDCHDDHSVQFPSTEKWDI